MKKSVLMATLMLSLSSLQAEERTESTFTQQANELIQLFSSSLKKTLVETLQTDGPVAAIAVCKEQAPQIAKSLSQQYGLNIGRTSLRTRNPNNLPDIWEKSVLDSFETRHQAGQKLTELSFIEKPNTQWRMMKAIPTGQVCLICHGEQLAPSVSDQLNRLYPHDQATGFKLGDIRGAFTVSEP
jgi:hypothetical protein